MLELELLYWKIYLLSTILTILDNSSIYIYINNRFDNRGYKEINLEIYNLTIANKTYSIVLQPDLIINEYTLDLYNLFE